MAFNFSLVEIARPTPMNCPVAPDRSTMPPRSVGDDILFEQKKLGPKSAASIHFEQNKACLRQRPRW
jgi:hypothetical protein